MRSVVALVLCCELLTSTGCVSVWKHGEASAMESNPDSEMEIIAEVLRDSESQPMTPKTSGDRFKRTMEFGASIACIPAAIVLTPFTYIFIMLHPEGL